VQTHNADAQLEKITCPTLVTFGRFDQVTSTRFAERLVAGITGAELLVFEDCAHAPIYQNVDEFNQRTLAFLGKYTG
jgi:pimeloyl-ACP methyl ester carboxylesterase